MAGDDAREELFEEVVAATQRRIIAIARSHAGPSEWQDLCQEIMLQMWRGLAGFEGGCTLSTGIRDRSYRIVTG